MYDYEREKEWCFTERGQVQFLSIRDKVKSLLKMAGCFDMGSAISGQSGSSFEMMACVDRLVELGEIREIEQGKCAGQHRVFVQAF